MPEVQLTIWDIEITKKPSSVTKIEENITEIKGLNTKKDSSVTEQQSNVMEKYKAHLNLNRIIHYCGGGVGIELKQEDGFRTIYVNREGKEEFTKDKKLAVLPMDKILLYKEELKTNEIQEQRLTELKDNIIKVVRRKGDENVIVEIKDKVISINSKGWILEFNNCKTIYEEKEILNTATEEPKDKNSIGESVRVGDIVQAYHGKEIIQGQIVQEYGIGNQILNIIFDNGKKHTAIGRIAVIEIIKGAGGVIC